MRRGSGPRRGVRWRQLLLLDPDGSIERLPSDLPGVGEARLSVADLTLNAAGRRLGAPRESVGG